MYITIFPRSLGKELLIIPRWVVSVTASAHPSSSLPFYGEQGKEKNMGFLLGDTVGYVTREGVLLYKEKVLHNAAVSDQGFINYSALPKNLLLKDPWGRFCTNVQVDGYPFIRRNRLFVLSQDGCRITEVSFQGEIKWERNFNQLITTVDAGTSDAVVGLLDVCFFVLKDTGDLLYQEQEREGISHSVYCVSISANDRFIGIVLGIHPQRGILLERTVTGYRRLSSFELSSDYRRAIEGLVVYPPGIFFFEDPEGIRLIDANLSQPVPVSLEGKLNRISGPIADGIVTAWTHTKGRHVISGVNFYGKKVFFKSFSVEGPFCFKVWDSSFLIGILDQILYFEVKAG
jgi:hypothetical protein